MNNVLPTIIADNFFTNPKDVIKLSKTYKYHIPTKENYWAGRRSDCLHIKNYNFYKQIILKVLSYYYPNVELTFTNSAVYFHKIKPNNKGKNKFHFDKNYDVAAIVYLNKSDIKTGTTIFNKDNKKQIIVSNDYNTMVCYDTKKYHGPTSLNLVDERLTLNIFIKNIKRKT